jgi:hypothetical protein
MERQVVKCCLPTTIVNEGKCWRGLLPDLVLFKLVAPCLQPGVVRPFLIWGVWFSGYLLLEGTSHIKNFGL